MKKTILILLISSTYVTTQGMEQRQEPTEKNYNGLKESAENEKQHNFEIWAINTFTAILSLDFGNSELAINVFIQQLCATENKKYKDNFFNSYHINPLLFQALLYLINPHKYSVPDDYSYPAGAIHNIVKKRKLKFGYGPRFNELNKKLITIEKFNAQDMLEDCRKITKAYRNKKKVQQQQLMSTLLQKKNIDVYFMFKHARL
ncbi:MAG: hypothetical protein JW725_04490 [Candidatus Babeliaceae bacterium]|nr:hypothetical protein [Candidatus Babeliaceae bacterium]